MRERGGREGIEAEREKMNNLRLARLREGLKERYWHCGCKYGKLPNHTKKI